MMETFSIWHWLVVLLIVGVPLFLVMRILWRWGSRK